MENLLKGLPWWVKWIGIPVIALVVFSSLIGMIVGLLFKALVFVALVGGLIYVVKRVTSSSDSGSRRDW
ncbi:DUF5326 family protein [Streptomyces sp. NPDC051976]|jgi:hypothetical protein|uniref:DUF5326 family protein n=1 Tax=Streptomyces sp. NPDC051976 TaxID=3154947 RepID=UPI00342461BD